MSWKPLGTLQGFAAANAAVINHMPRHRAFNNLGKCKLDMKKFFHITSKQLSLDSPRLALPVGPLENLLPHIRHHPPPAAPPSRPLDWPAGPHCPQCRGRFFRRAPLPRPTEHGWRQLVAPTGLRRELAAGPDGLVWSFFMEKMSGTYYIYIYLFIYLFF